MKAGRVDRGGVTRRTQWVRIAAILRARPSFVEQALYCIYQRAEVAGEIIRAHPPNNLSNIGGFITFVVTKGRVGSVSLVYLDHLANHYFHNGDKALMLLNSRDV